MAAQIQAAKFVELAGDDHIAWIGDTEPLMAEVREFLTGERPALEAVRVLATVLFIDIVQSTSRLASQMDDDRCADQLDLHWFSQRLWFPRNMRLHSLRKRRCSLWHPPLEQLRVLAKGPLRARTGRSGKSVFDPPIARQSTITRRLPAGCRFGCEARQNRLA
jgi:hypothetical protein